MKGDLATAIKDLEPPKPDTAGRLQPVPQKEREAKAERLAGMPRFLGGSGAPQIQAKMKDGAEPHPPDQAHDAHEPAHPPTPAPEPEKPKLPLFLAPQQPKSAHDGAAEKKPPKVQAKMKVGEQGDAFEQAADAVAEHADGGEAHDHEGGEAPTASVPREEPPEWMGMPDGGAPLASHVRAAAEPALGVNLGAVRVHHGPKAAARAGAMGARAFTHRNHVVLGPGESPHDTKLMAHEAAHAAQQTVSDTGSDVVESGGPAPSPQGAAPPASEPTPDVQLQQGTPPAGGKGNTSFNFGEDEMASRLEGTPGGGEKPPTPKPQQGTQGKLNEAGKDKGKKGDKKDPKGDKDKHDKKQADKAKGKGQKGGPPSAPPAPPDPTPGPAGAFEGMVDKSVGAYLDTTDPGTRVQPLSENTKTLLEAAKVVSQKPVVEPERSALGELTGVNRLVDAFTKAPPGYEKEEPWLRTLARIRDIASALGGIVGTIGLIATVSGAILSLLLPPVGAFLLTVGRFCDIAAIILDVVTLVLSAILTGYNLYRLKHATNPEEKRRLLALVRQDAMSTVMAGVSVAMAVIPGAGKALGKTKLGMRAGNALARLGGKVGALLGKLPGARILRSAREAAVGTVHRGAEWLRNTRVIQRINQRALGWEQRMLARLANRPRILRIYQSNIGLSRVIHEASQRGYQVDIGRRMKAELDRLQRNPALSVQQIGQRLEQKFAGVRVDPNTTGIRFGGHQFAVTRHPTTGTVSFVGASWDSAIPRPQRQAMLARLRALSVGPPPVTDIRQLERALGQQFGFREPRSVFFNLERDASGRITFPREDSTFLLRLRREEADAIRAVQAGLPPGHTPQQLTAAVNSNPAVRGHWTPEELQQFLTSGASVVPKTPHHTIPAQVAPHLAQDPRFIQIANDPRSYGTFVRNAYPGHQPVFNLTDLQTAIQNGQIRGISDIGYFRGPHNQDFIRALQRGGGTGVWINPFDASQRFVFNPHIVIGHNWVTTDPDIIRKIFGPFAEREGEIWGRLFREGLRQGSRTIPRSVFDRPKPGALPPGPNQPAVAQAPPASYPVESNATAEANQSVPEPRPLPSDVTAVPETGPQSTLTSNTASAAVPTSGSAGFLASLRSRMTRGVVALSTGPNAPASAPLGPSETPSAAPPAAGTASPEKRDLPEPPPPVTEYSPRSLAEIGAEKAEINTAIASVQALVAAAKGVKADNKAAEAKATSVKGQNEARKPVIAGEKADVAGQQGKLDQAGGAQQGMLAENDKGQNEGKKGENEGKATEAKGNETTVEAKPEEKKKKGWLARAWDATAGAAWRALVAPAIRLVKRKVKQVMEKINQFIMKMINSVLGLDEIEAELNKGGADIGNKKGDLSQTTTGHDQANTQTDQAIQKNEQTISDAKTNQEDAAGAQSEAEQVLAALRDQKAALEEEEESAKSYIQGFGVRYAAFFDPKRNPQGGKGGEGGEATATATPASPPPQAPQAQGQDTGEKVGESQVSMVVVWVAAVRRGDDDALAELNEVSASSEGAISPALKGEERAATGAALTAFKEGRAARATRLAGLMADARACIGMPMDAGAERLQQIGDEVFDLAQQVESARAQALQAIGSTHEQAVQAGGATSEPPPPPPKKEAVS